MAPLALLLASSFISPAEPPPAVLHGGRVAPNAWLAVHRGALWICWDDAARRGPPDPDCWRRVDLPTTVDPRELRAVFLDAATAAIRGSDDRTLQITRGDPTAQPAELAAEHVEPRGRPAPLACSTIGHVPIYLSGRWAWRDAPCPEEAGSCVAPPLLPRLRRPIGVDLSFGLEVRTRERRGADTSAQAIAGAEIVAIFGAAFDPAGWFGRRLAWQELQSARRPQLRDLPALRSTGPLATHEREALAAAVCGGRAR